VLRGLRYQASFADNSCTLIRSIGMSTLDLFKYTIQSRIGLQDAQVPTLQLTPDLLRVRTPRKPTLDRQRTNKLFFSSSLSMRKVFVIVGVSLESSAGTLSTVPPGVVSRSHPKSTTSMHRRNQHSLHPLLCEVSSE
jgi:hypothetical protein